MHNIFSITFTNSHLLVKKNYLGRIHKFELTDISHIDILLIREAEYFKIKRGRGWHANVSFNLKIYLKHNNEKTFSLKSTSSARKRSSWDETRHLAFDKRDDFEEKLKTLEELFPNLIIVEDLIPEKRKPRLKDFLLLLMVFGLMFFFLLFEYHIDPARAIEYLIMLLIVFISMPFIMLYLKLKNKKENEINENTPSTN